MSDIEPVLGIHHVTAITGDAQGNIDFYCGVLGLRLVKLAVNFDDPSSYHLYYGDELGRPGTAMTFFAWGDARRGTIGPPQATVTAFAVARDAVGYWQVRLHEHGIATRAAVERFGEPVLAFDDPDGLHLELIGVDTPRGVPWARGPVPVEHAIHGFHSVTLSEAQHEATGALMTEVMGCCAVASEGNRYRYRAGDGIGAFVDVVEHPEPGHGAMGTGVVHHVAFRARDAAHQSVLYTMVAARAGRISEVMDRVYFQSIYFREPGGVLFEIATDGPGFTADETVEQLGSALKLPPWYEARRGAIEAGLPRITLPQS